MFVIYVLNWDLIELMCAEIKKIGVEGMHKFMEINLL